MTDITMPSLADGMEQGTIISWLIPDGAPVSAGDELAEIETDKATMTYAAEASGVLSILAAEGSTIAVGDVIARLGVAREAPSREPAAAVAPEVDAPVKQAQPAIAESAAVRNGNGDAASAPVPGIGATPLARRAAAVHGVALATISGTGPTGRITKNDVLIAAGVETAAPAPPPERSARSATPQVSAGGAAAKGSSTLREPTRLQQIAARRMAEAKATIPHFQVQTEVEIDAALALRADLKAVAGEGDPVPSVNDLIVRAAALALRDHPLVNGSYKDGRFELHERINVGIAVASDEGLVVVTVVDADVKALGQIARDARRLAQRVRSGEITPPELAGATFTVSNLGMFGMTAITAVINPPQAAILGVGAARDTLARVDGEIVDRRLLTLTLSCDHRILNGADGSRFLFDVKRLLEAPLRLAL
jgi:pyruvate dehydrogenase E2 component (dihydrolipoamide acetyltransferase)